MNNDVFSSRKSRTKTWAPIEILDSEPLTTDDDVQIVNNCVTIDNDSDVILQDGPVIVDLDSDDLEIIESDSGPIIIEDEGPSHVVNPLNVLKKKQDELFNTVCQENRLLAQLIEEAINLDNTGSMKRIIQRTLIPLYLNLTEAHKESEQFKNSVKKTTMLLETAPHLKYSHIKTLCHSMKFTNVQKNKCNILRKQRRYKRKKEAPITTIEKTVEEKYRKYCTQSLPHNRIPKKSIENTKYITTRENGTNGRKNNESKRVETEKNNINGKINNKSIKKRIQLKQVETAPNPTLISPTSNKENVITDNKQTPELTLHTNFINTTTNTVTNINNNLEIDLNNLLTPHYEVSAEVPQDKTEVEYLEEQIAVLKKNLEIIEEKEVINDDGSSPYLLAETMKIKIVKLYKQLCDIVGAEPNKRHEVKVQVLNGHPPGPARCLEEYINNNIDECGNPPFPDIFEVVRCVERAVEEDGLRWNRKQIVAEAQVLLKHYGQAIQKSRKKREWRDMISHCKEDIADPADMDPALEAKLLENSRIAKRNEDEIIDRYARLERENISNPAFRLHLESGTTDSESDCEEDTHVRHKSSTNKLQNLQRCPNVINSTYIQGNSSISNSKTNLRVPSNDENGLLNRPDIITNSLKSVNSNTQSALTLMCYNNIVESIDKSTSNVTDVTTNIENCPMLLVNSLNNLHPPPNLHGKICFINSKPVLATRIPDGAGLINSTNDPEGNSQNEPKNMPNNLQNVLNENSNNLTDNQNEEPIINTPDNLQNRRASFINTYCDFITQNKYSMADTVNKMNDYKKRCMKLRRVKFQSPLSGIKTKYTKNSANSIESNLEHGFNNMEGNLQSRSGILNSSNNNENNLEQGSNNIEGNIQNSFNILNPTNNVEVSLQSGLNNAKPHSAEINLENKLLSRSSITNAIDNLEEFSQDCPISTTTDTTSIGGVEYNRTILMDSYESDTDNNTKEKDKSDTDEMDSKINMMELISVPNRTIMDLHESKTDNDSIIKKERDKNNANGIEHKIKIKQEEEDVIQLLSELNSDCVATVFDIEDPFLVIEISDSSDEDE